MTEDAVNNPGTTGLILSGGGARAAYQVGVLAAIADLLPDSSRNPFPVIVGTSAGAINAVSLACGALHFCEAVRRLSNVWRSIHTDQVYRSDWPGVLHQASRFIGHSVLGIASKCPLRCSIVRHWPGCSNANWIYRESPRHCAIGNYAQ